MMRLVVAVVARVPSFGGKSRLVRELGLDDGTALRVALLRDTLEAVAPVEAEKAILYTPDAGAGEIRALTPFPAIFLPQHGATLGDRMRRGGQELATRGFDGVVLIGSDLPTLPAAYVSSALASLTMRPERVVLGPSDDGGYYLLGLTRWPADLFERMPWGTPLVLKRTVEAAAKVNMPVELLPTWHDVDSARDLGRVWHSSAPHNAAGRHTRAWLTSVEPAVRDLVERSEPR